MDQLIEIDRQLLVLINNFCSPYADIFFWHTTQRYWWIALYIIMCICLVRRYGLRSLWLIVVLVAAAGLSDFISSGLIKHWVCRPRPTHEPALEGLLHIVNGYRGGQYGFVSSHAANTFSLALLFSLIWKDWRVTLPLMVWTALNCYGRMYLGVHYPGDILGGLAVGALVAVAAYYLLLYIEHKCQYKEKATLINGWWHWGIGIVFTLLCIIALIPF